MASYYNVYGFVIKVSGTAESSFQREYYRFEISSCPNANLEIVQVDNLLDKAFKISPVASTKGIFIDFKTNKVYYEEGLNDFVLYYTEPLIQWPDKVLLHAGAVEKDGKAYLFPAAGGVGKTAMVTELSKRGYRYLADDWVIVDKDGMAYPFYKNIHIMDYNLKDKELAKKVLGWKRIPYKIYFWIINLLHDFETARPARFVLEKLKKDFKVDVSKLFKEVGKPSKIKRIFWLKVGKELSIKKSSIKELIKQMSYVNDYEHNHFLKEYQRYAYHYGSIKMNRSLKILSNLKCDIFEVIVPKKINPNDVLKIFKYQGVLE